METICLQCGNKGYDNAFVFCVKCVNYAVHRYCLDEIPEDFNEFVHWVCDYCEEPRKDSIVSIETEENVYEDVPQHLYDAYTKIDFLERPKASTDFEQNSRQQLEKGKAECNLTQPEKLSDFLSPRSGMKKKRKLIKKLSEPEMTENPVLSCNVSSKSSKKKKKKKKKKTLTFSEVNLKEQNEKKDGIELENRCVDTRTEGSAICRSNSHEINGGLDGEELPEDTNMLDCAACAEPIITPIWSGSFNMSGRRHDILDGLKGHVSSKACQKVYDEISLFQPELHLQMLSQSDVWPKSFQLSDPKEENIALFFFPSEISEPAYDQMIDEMRESGLALKGFVQNAEILVFTSTVLPVMYWRFNNKHYLWGVFRAKQLPPSDPSSHAVEPGNDQSRDDNPVTMTSCGAPSSLSIASNGGCHGSGSS